LKGWLAIAIGAILISISGCARYPESGGGPGSKRLIFTMQLAEAVNPNYVYIVALNPSTETNPTAQGPLPVIAPPWGNGFVSGTATHFVRWDSFQSPRYQLYRFNNPTLIEYFPVGVPIDDLEVLPGGRQIKFTLELSQIANGVDPSLLKSLQVNFLTMNVVPQGNTGDKVWDALGDGRTPSGINEFVTIPLTGTGIYNNARFLDFEPNGDVVDPSLDIVDWVVEVRN
jgi:hypothetical protein